MSRILGIISEYNPFHNGHLYQLEKSIERASPDYTVCVMSGNFVQRGDTSIIDKWTKTQIALQYGFDLVLELPTVYAVSSAENFAMGAVKILNSLSKDVTLSFGSESGDISILKEFANILCEEPPEYRSLLSHELKTGISYPKARENALLMYLNDIRRYANVLSSSNNILAIEYLKAIIKLKSKMIPMTIKRKSVDYNSLDTVDGFASATAIRKMIQNNEDIKEFLPEASYNKTSEQIKRGKIVPGIAAFEKQIIYTLRRMTLEEISQIADVTEGLENRIKEASDSCNNLEDLISMIKTKRYTLSRIQRILIYAMLGITKKDIFDSYSIKPYVRVLGCNQKGKILLSEIKHTNRNIKIVSSVKRFMDKNNNKALKNMMEKDILASNIYTLGYEYDSQANLDYTEKLIVL